jgi:hypothetical protein
MVPGKGRVDRMTGRIGAIGSKEMVAQRVVLRVANARKIEIGGEETEAA